MSASVLLDLRLPLAFFKKLLGLPVGLSDLDEVEPRVAQSLKKLLEWEARAAGVGRVLLGFLLLLICGGGGFPPVGF